MGYFARWGLTALAALVVSGCNSSLKECTSDSDCPSSQWCDSSVRICVAYSRPDDTTFLNEDGGRADGGSTSDDGGSTGDSGVTDAGADGWALTLTSPTDDTATNATLQVLAQVSKTDGTTPTVSELPLELQLLLDGALLTKVGRPSYSYQWDTSGVAEGPHNLMVELIGPQEQVHRSASKRVVVDRTAPTAPKLTVTSPTKAQPVPVNGTAEAGTTVRLYEGTTKLGEDALVDASGAWATATPLTEGKHDVRATATDAAGNVSSGATATIIVDRTAPSVTARVPLPGATNVWSRTPITVTFSEEMNPASITDSAVQFVCTKPDATNITIAKTLPLAQDTTTHAWVLTIQPLALPPVPSSCVIVLSSGLTDVAGNGLTDAATTWSWQLPDWQDLGAVASGSSKWHVTSIETAVANDGTPLAAVGSNWPGVYQWDAGVGGWSVLSDALPTGYADSVSLLTDSTQTLWAAWSQAGGAWASSWAGTTWSTLALNVDATQGATTATLGLDNTGAPVVAWAEPSGGITRVFVRRWSVGQWQLLGTGSPSPADSNAAGVSLGLDASGRLTVRSIQTNPTTMARSFWVGTWTGSAWECVGAACSGQVQTAVTGGALQVNPAGQPYIGWIDTGVTPNAARVWRYSFPSFVAFGGQALLNIDPTMAASSSSFALDETGAPVLAWAETTATGRSVHVKRWTGTEWAALGGDAAAGAPGTPGSVTLGLGKGGLVSVAFMSGEGVGASATTRLIVRRYNR